MADETQSGAADRSAIGFGVGLVLGMAVGVGIGVLVAPKDGASSRRELGARARRLCDDAALLTREAGDAASVLAAEGTELAKRVRSAANEGVREARRHIAAAREPDRSALAGVDGLSDPV